MTQITLSSLHPNYTYEVAVAATTRMGAGPFTVPVLVTTHSDGKPTRSYLVRQTGLALLVKMLAIVVAS